MRLRGPSIFFSMRMLIKPLRKIFCEFVCLRRRNRGSITGVATGLGGMLHTVPFLIPKYALALKLAYVVVACELVAIAFIRCRFMGGQLAKTIIRVVVGGAVVFAIGVWLGRAGIST